MLSTVSKIPPPRRTGQRLVERIVDMVMTMEAEGGARCPEVARRLDAGVNRVRGELLQLESIGCVYRTGKKRGTRWWVG